MNSIRQLADDELFISSIAVFEIFVGVNIENVNLINQLFEGFRILPFDS